MSANKSVIQRQLCEWTHATPQDAARLLKTARYNLEAAVDLYYSDPLAQRNTERANIAAASSYGPKLESLWDHYYNQQAEEDREPDLWEVNATLAWCQDLGVDPEDAVMLAVAHLCQAKDMGQFVKQGWIDGWKSAHKDSIEGQQEHVQHLRSEMSSNAQLFRKIYSYTFDYARGTENAMMRVLPCETACALWDLLLPVAPEMLFQPDSAYCFTRDKEAAQTALDKWKSFLMDPSGGKGRAISKDVWNQFLDFALLMDGSFSKHDPENDAWPSIIDSFVEHCKEG